MANIQLVANVRTTGYQRPSVQFCNGMGPGDTMSANLTSAGGTSLGSGLTTIPRRAIGLALIGQGATLTSQYELRDAVSGICHGNLTVAEMVGAAG